MRLSQFIAVLAVASCEAQKPMSHEYSVSIAIDALMLRGIKHDEIGNMLRLASQVGLVGCSSPQFHAAQELMDWATGTKLTGGPQPDEFDLNVMQGIA